MVFLSVMSSCLRLNRAVPIKKEMSCHFPLLDICEDQLTFGSNTSYARSISILVSYSTKA